MWSLIFIFSKPLSSLILFATYIDEIDAVNRETSAIPANIIKTANNLPSGVLGEKSPYPTVVSVMRDHQIVSGIVVNISGRGDKDINTVADLEGIEI